MLTWKIGDVVVTRIVEMDFPLPCTHLFPGSDPDALQGLEWLAPFVADNGQTVLLSIHALVVDTATCRIVIDTCMGNDKPRPSMAGQVDGGFHTDFLDRLESAGFPPDSVDVVLCTHLHVDHVGWNTRLVDGVWVPTFPRARYLIGRTEFDYCEQDREGDAPVIFADSIKPLIDAGLVDLVDVDHVICEEVDLISTPGHTPGHVSVRISSNGEHALITGDMVHHPCQLVHPEWGSALDTDRGAAIATRRAQFADLADQPVLVIGTHFMAPTAGHIVADGEAYRLVG